MLLFGLASRGTPDLVMRKLAHNYRILVAAPDYLESRGAPVVPQDLTRHECILYRSAETPGGRLVVLSRESSRAESRVPPALQQWRGQRMIGGARRLWPHPEILGGRCARRSGGPPRPSPAGVAQRAHAGLRPLPLKPATAPPCAPLPRRHGGAARRHRSAVAPPRDFVIVGS